MREAAGCAVVVVVGVEERGDRRDGVGVCLLVGAVVAVIVEGPGGFQCFEDRCCGGGIEHESADDGAVFQFRPFERAVGDRGFGLVGGCFAALSPCLAGLGGGRGVETGDGVDDGGLVFVEQIGQHCGDGAADRADLAA